MPIKITISRRYLITSTHSKYNGQILELDPLANNKDFLVSAKRYDDTWLHFHKDDEVKLVSTVKRLELRKAHGVKFELVGISVDMTDFDAGQTNPGWFALGKSGMFVDLFDKDVPYSMDRFYQRFISSRTFDELKEAFAVYATKEQMCTYEGFSGILNHPNNSALAMNQYGAKRIDIDTVKSDFYVVYISQA